MDYFNRLIERFCFKLKTDQKTISMPYKIDFDFSKAGYFIDCDTFVETMV
jgi:hypothetical protein